MLVKDLQEEKNDIKKRYENEPHDLNNNIEILRNQLLNREDLVRRSHRECMDYQCRMEAIECDIRRGYQQPLQDLNKKIVALELELMDARNSNRKLDSARHSAMEEERMEMDNLKSELTRIKNCKNTLPASFCKILLALLSDTEQ
jgi:chromosome segregation ATPase